MSKKLDIVFDSDLIESISSDFDLRAPNKEALRQLIFTLNGEYDPNVIQVLNLATGVGKTYLMAAFIEYLRHQGVKNVMIVTPGKVVQSKTVQNFTPGTSRYIVGSQVPPDIVTPDNYSEWIARMNGATVATMNNDAPILAFIFNIQQLIAPKESEGATHSSTEDAIRRKPRKFDENAGVLFDYLKELDDLVVIADESHLYSSSAESFNAALKELDPAATIGLTASVLPDDHVIYKYPLYKAIQDKYIKAPVLAFRKNGYGEDKESEEQQLRDALKLREIKQAYYDIYAEKEGKDHINAVCFVVCSDVDHATQIADLLRTPGYLGKSISVLQVDSKHDGDDVQKLLENLDEPDSSVLAVVSVNKLKEGWDVKNVAVVVTLRAMASEVLTQQTMGRGLRLPFGVYTGIWQIDQLDIISHQSFKELLESENILSQFGLEDAVSNSDKKEITRIIQDTIRNDVNIDKKYDSSSNERNVLWVNDSVVEGNDHDNNQVNTHTIGVATIDDGDFNVDDSFNIDPVYIERNETFANVSYKFPVTTVEIKQPPIDLSEIEDETIERAARKVTSAGDVLYRKEIVAALGKKLSVKDAESAEVDSIPIDESTTQETLSKLVVNMQLVPKTDQTVRYVKNFLVPKFMHATTINSWTVKSLDSAKVQLQDIIQKYISSIQKSATTFSVIKPKIITPERYMIPIGERIYDPIDNSKEFVRRRFYSGWFKSLYETESFDSYSGEYELARILNTSPHIVWWHRLHGNYGAFIYYTPVDRYFPDFVALDDEGVHWIIEGKDQRGRDDVTVQSKRKAAEALVRKISIEDAYTNEKWGYLIAYEDDIAKADSWNDLKALSQPVSNVVR